MAQTGRGAAFALLSGVLTAVVGVNGVSAAESWPSQVAARYKLYFNGLEVGTYQFGSRFDGKGYEAESEAKVSALFGAFKWNGSITSHGAIQKSAPQPAAYRMSYRGKKREVSVSLGFDKGKVSSVQLVPNKPPSPESVPLLAEHYVGVFDPMTAILAISHPEPKNPCNRRIPIFDGKARFDLAMSYKGQERLKEKDASGQPRELVVCRVKYQPVAGHKPKDFVDPWIDYNRIEIALRPVPSAGLFVPYRITIPTTIGNAEMTADRIDITSGDQEQIALRQE